MKLLLLVTGCCVALAVSKPAEDACAAMRARLLPSLEPSARADAGALRACDADSDGTVDAAELVSCVQRAFGSTAHMDRAEIGERIHCFWSIITDTALRGEQRQMIDTEQVCQLGSGSGSVSGLHCEGQNQLAQILAAIVDGQLQAAYDALIDWYIGSFLQSTSPSNGLLNKESFNPQFLHAEKSSKTLVYLLTAFVRSANNELTSPVEDALISSLLAVSVGNLDVARSVIKPGLDAEVLNPATQDEFQWIIDAFDAGFTEDAVTRIISLLAGCPTSEARLTQAYASIYIQLLEVYDQITKESAYGKDAFLAFWKRIQNGEPPVSEEDMKLFTDLAYEYEEGGSVDAAVLVMEFLTIPCENIFDISFSNGIFNLISTMKLGYFESSLAEFKGLLTDNRFANNPTYDEVLSQLKAALDKVNNSDYDGALEEMRKILVTCICKSETTEE